MPRTGWCVLVAALPLACSGATPARCAAPPSAEVRVPASDAGTSSPPTSSPRAARPAPELLIDDGGVGELRIGEAIPKRFLEGDKEARGRYEIRWIADAQPFEAFGVGEPPVLAVFQGPFSRWAESNAGELEPGRFVDEALREARAGAAVEWIVVQVEGPATHAGIGVGSSYSELAAAYPEAKLTRLPEWFESKPTCSVRVPELKRVAFHLASCSAGDSGDVIRVIVSR